MKKMLFLVKTVAMAMCLLSCIPQLAVAQASPDTITISCADTIPDISVPIDTSELVTMTVDSFQANCPFWPCQPYLLREEGFEFDVSGCDVDVSNITSDVPNSCVNTTNAMCLPNLSIFDTIYPIG